MSWKRAFAVAYAVGGAAVLGIALAADPGLAGSEIRFSLAVPWLLAAFALLYLSYRSSSRTSAFLVLLGLTLGVGGLTSYSYTVHQRLNSTVGRELPELDFEHTVNAATAPGLGGDWTVLSFWTPFCPPCIAEFPLLQAFSDAHGDLVQVVGISFLVQKGPPPQDQLRDLRGVLLSHGVEYPSVVSLSYEAVQPYGFRALPTTVLVNPDRIVVEEVFGSEHLPFLLAKARKVADGLSN